MARVDPGQTEPSVIPSLSLLRSPTDKISLDERRYVPLSSVQSLYVVELKLPLRTRLARQTHARRMHNH
jgi:hypothetical protein